MSGLLPDGLSHSEISGSNLVCKSPELIAAYHVFLRLQEPRHSPCALSYFLTTLTLRCARLYLISLIMSMNVANLRLPGTVLGLNLRPRRYRCNVSLKRAAKQYFFETWLQKGGVPAAPSGTATLLRLSPSHRFCPRSLLAVTNFKHPQLPWLDGRCVQGPGTYSPRHG